MMHARRLVAQKEAKRILAECKKGKRIISDADVTLVLRKWAFARNTTRVNVMPDEAKFVRSDTLGLLRTRTGEIHLTPPSQRYPEVLEVISQWLSDRLPFTEAKDFKWTR